MRSPRTTAIAHTRSGPPSGAVAIVGSAAGIPALIDLLRELPRSFGLPVFVSQHLARLPSLLPQILAWRSMLTVGWAAEGEQPKCHVAPPGTSLTVAANGLAVRDLPPTSASWLGTCDRLIASVAAIYGPRSVAIVLNGMMPAGIRGLREVRARGGITMAQNSASSIYFDMPHAVVDLGKADIVLTPSRLAGALQVIAEDWAARRPGSRASEPARHCAPG